MKKLIVIVLVALLLGGCHYETTCWTDGVEVYHSAGSTMWLESKDYAPQKRDQDYWRLPDGRIIRGRCECWLSG